MTDGTWGPAEWAAFGSCAAVAVYVVLGVLAYVQIRQVKGIRKDEIRPYVIVDFSMRGMLIQIVIKNIGRTPARDVRITFDHPLERPRAQGSTEGDINQSSVFARPIPFLAPGRELKVFFGVGHQLIGSEEVRQSYWVTTAYSDLKGKGYRDPATPLDLSHLANVMVGPDGLPELVKAVKGLAGEAKKWTDGGSGLLVQQVDRSRWARRREREWRRDEGREILTTKGWIAFLRWQYKDLRLRVNRR